MALKTLRPRLDPMPAKTVGGENHQPKARWGQGRRVPGWAKLRRLTFERDKYTCQSCGRVGGNLECDHILNQARGGSDDLSNLQTLCRECHRLKTYAESQAPAEVIGHTGKVRYQVKPEWLKPIPGSVIVFGPPGSGKSTWVKKHIPNAKSVIDLDEIAAEITGKPLYHKTDEELGMAIRERNRRLIKHADFKTPCVLLLTGTKKKDRTWWIRKLQPTRVEVMDTSAEECIRRIEADNRRPESVKKRQISEVKRWEC